MALRWFQRTDPPTDPARATCEREAAIAEFLASQQRQRVTVETLEAEIRALPPKGAA